MMALNFPAKVYQILENESTDIIRWHENGMAFRILDHGRFEREIIPKYFRHNQLSSVQRQLNLYGFKCISRGEDKGAFFHTQFKRGDWDTVRKITRYVPPKRTFPEGGIPEKKMGEDDYIFRDGAYQSASSLRNDNPHGYNNTPQSNYYEADSFALFQPPPTAGLNSDSTEEWPLFSQVAKQEDKPQQQVQQRVGAPPVFRPQVPPPTTQRLDYKFPSVRQMTAPKTGNAPREFIIITNGVVKIDPDYDLADCLNISYDYDVGRHSVNSPPPQPALPVVQQPQQPAVMQQHFQPLQQIQQQSYPQMLPPQQQMSSHSITQHVPQQQQQQIQQQMQRVHQIPVHTNQSQGQNVPPAPLPVIRAASAPGTVAHHHHSMSAGSYHQPHVYAQQSTQQHPTQLQQQQALQAGSTGARLLNVHLSAPPQSHVQNQHAQVHYMPQQQQQRQYQQSPVQQEQQRQYQQSPVQQQQIHQQQQMQQQQQAQSFHRYPAALPVVETTHLPIHNTHNAHNTVQNVHYENVTQHRPRSHSMDDEFVELCADFVDNN